MLYDFTHRRRYLEHSDSEREKAEWFIPRAAGRVTFNGSRVSVLQDENSSGVWLHSNVNVLNTPEPYT